MQPLGAFYLGQSVVAGLPAVFLASWIAVFTLSSWLDPAGSVSRYLGQYVWLLAVAILVEILAFVLPMLSVHGLMAAYKQAKLLPEADALSRSIASTIDPATTEPPDDPMQRFRELEDAPTWPVDRRIRRRFTLRNLALLLPQLGTVLGQKELFAQISDLLGAS